MATQIFVNLPVKDLKKTMDFFTALGFSFNMQFSNEDAACLVISDNIFAMLLTEPFFSSFLKGKKEIADSATTTEVMNALSLDSRDAVNEIVDKAIAAGATEFTEAQDHGWMYTRNFQDLDGHIWEWFYADMSALGDQHAADASK